MAGDKKEKKSFFRTAKAELKKVVWLDRKSWFKRVVVVLVMAIIIALIIALFDFVIKYGVDLLLSL